MSINYNSYQITSPPSRRIQKELEKYKKNLRNPIDYKFNYSSITCDLDSIRWEDLKVTEYTQGGGTSLFLCMFNSNQACTVKGIGNVVEDIFTSRLYEIMNIHVHKSKVILYSQPEFKLAINSLERVTIHDKYVGNCVRRQLDRPFFIASQYIPGLYFLQMTRRRAEECFGLDPGLGYRRLREIGEIIAMDIFMNNSSRIPVIWNGDGNPNTFLISAQCNKSGSEDLLDPNSQIKMTNVYAIDSCCSCLDKSDENAERVYSQYLERVDRYIRGNVRDLTEVLEGKTFGALTLPTMEVVKDFFYKHTSIEVTNQQLFQVLKGVMGTFKDISEMDNSEIIEIYQAVKNIPDEDWMDVWRTGIDKINLEFLFDVKNAISNVVQGNPKSFEWVYLMYKIDDPPLYF